MLSSRLDKKRSFWFTWNLSRLDVCNVRKVRPSIFIATSIFKSIHFSRDDTMSCVSQCDLCSKAWRIFITYHYLKVITKTMICPKLDVYNWRTTIIREDCTKLNCNLLRTCLANYILRWQWFLRNWSKYDTTYTT